MPHDDNIQRSEIRYRRLFEAAHDGILIIDPISRQITDSNPFMSQLLGYSHEELLGKELWQIGLLKDEEASQSAFRELQSKGLIRYEDLPLKTKTGEVREVEFVSNIYDESGTNVIQCNIRDITERKQTQAILKAKDEAQATLIQAAKMASLQRLVAGIAHEINNPMMFVITNLFTAERAFKNIAPTLQPLLPEESMAKYQKGILRLGEMNEGLERIKQLVLSLRTFAGTGEDEMNVADVAGSIDSVLSLLSYSFKGRIKVETVIDSQHLLYCSAVKLNQILVSLVTNAIESIDGVGTITIHARPVDNAFVFSIRDTGKGIPETIRNQIFDPFFTTKESGVGGGLGLSIVHGIVQEHLGSIEVESKEGSGSEFIVKIPLDLESRLHQLSQKNGPPH